MSTKVQHLDKLFEKVGIVPNRIPSPVSSINMHSAAKQRRNQLLHKFIDNLRLRQKLIDQKSKFYKDNPKCLTTKLINPKQPIPTAICTIEPPILPPSSVEALPIAFKHHEIASKTSHELFARQTKKTPSDQPSIKPRLPSLSSICDMADSIFDHIRHGDFDQAKKFLISGGDPNLCDAQGKPLVHLAIASRNESVMTLFIDHPRLDLNKIDAKSKQSALHLTVRNQNAKYTEKLLHLRHPVDMKDINGQTPLHVACLLGHYDLIGCLLRYGASSKIVDDSGRTPFQFLHIRSTIKSIEKPTPQNIILKCQPNKPAELVLKIPAAMLPSACK